MKQFFTYLILISLLLIPNNLMAIVDRSNCDDPDQSQDFLKVTDTSSGTKDFVKICLPSDRETGSNTVLGLANANIRGGIYQIGNQVLCAMDDTVSTTQCIDPESKLVTGTGNHWIYYDRQWHFENGAWKCCADECSTYGGNPVVDYGDGCQNNDFESGPDDAYLGLADYDDNTTYGIDSDEADKTSSSTMASLVLDDEDTVIWAKLYWMGRTSSSSNSKYTKVKNIKFLTPTTEGIYKDITCTH